MIVGRGGCVSVCVHVVTPGHGGTAYGDLVAVHCDFCGANAPGDQAPLTWTLSVENGRSRVFCESCSREHLRSIESKLDSDFW
jgi:hypothetical protein